jgi:type I restriction enzyme M protein
VLVVDDKWLARIEQDVQSEMQRISQRLTGRIKELAERYDEPLPALENDVENMEKKVRGHLEKMGFTV